MGMTNLIVIYMFLTAFYNLMQSVVLQFIKI